MVVCVECLPANEPWDVGSATHRSSGVAPRACVRMYARVLVPPNLYIHTYIHVPRLEWRRGGLACKMANASRRTKEASVGSTRTERWPQHETMRFSLSAGACNIQVGGGW